MRVKAFLTLAVTAGLCAAAPKPEGSKACAGCHESIYRSYERTPMAVSSGSTGDGLFEQKFNKASFLDNHSAYRYSAGRDATGYFFDFQRRDAGLSHRRRLPYFVGSGATASAFLMSVDGFLFEAPVSYYKNSEAWQLSPGYESYSYPFLARGIAPGCLACHASGIRAIAGTQTRFDSPPFVEGGVSCQRCHGTGTGHIARMKAGKGGREGIVNPALLDAERRDSICAQCHLTGEVRVESARKGPFEAGDRLQDHVAAFVRARGEAAKVTSHFESMARSACKQASGDRLWCGTCHDPHGVPARAERTGWFRSKCLSCHAATDCGAPRPSRSEKQDDCTACHMPRNAVTDAQHVVYTDHSIPRRPLTTPREIARPDASLVPFGRQPTEARELGLAYAIVAVRTGNVSDRDRAFLHLQQAIKSDPDDPLTLSYLADLYKKRGEDADAERLYQRLLQVDPTNVSALAALGAYAMERGDTVEAIRLWTDALSRSPALLLVRANLAAAYLRTNRAAEARATLEKALEFHPEFPAARDLLRRMNP